MPNICVTFTRIKQQRPASPVPSCVSMKSDRSMGPPPKFSDGDRPADEKEYVLNTAVIQCLTKMSNNIVVYTQAFVYLVHLNKYCNLFSAAKKVSRPTRVIMRMFLPYLWLVDLADSQFSVLPLTATPCPSKLSVKG